MPLNIEQIRNAIKIERCAVNGSRVPSWRSQEFTPILTTYTATVFMLANLSTPLTVHMPNSTATAFNLLKFALKKKNKKTRLTCDALYNIHELAYDFYFIQYKLTTFRHVSIILYQ